MEDVSRLVKEEFGTSNAFSPERENEWMREQSQQFVDAQLRDLKSRRIYRFGLTLFFIGLLLAQYAYLIYFIHHALQLAIITDLQPLIGVLTTAMLAETYFVLRLIVQWVFKDVAYKPDHSDVL